MSEVDPVAFLRGVVANALERGEDVSINDAVRIVDALDRYAAREPGLAYADEVARIPDGDIGTELAKVRRPISAPPEAFRAAIVHAGIETPELPHQLLNAVVALGKDRAQMLTREATKKLRAELKDATGEITSLRRQVAQLTSTRVVVVEQSALPPGRADDPQREKAVDQLGAAAPRRELPPGIDPERGWPSPDAGRVFRRIGRGR